MKKIIFPALMLVVLSGCMQVNCVVEEKYPETENISKYDKVANIPYEYKVFGTCQVKGNYSDFSLDDMVKKIISCGEKNGADAVLILGMRVVPDGRVVVAGDRTNTIDATGAATTNTWEEINKDFSGGYGSIRNKNPSTIAAYNRIVRGEFLKFITDENGNLKAKKTDNSSASAAPLKTIKSMKKDLEKKSENEDKTE